MTETIRAARVLKAFGILVATAVLAVGVLIAVLSVERRTSLTLPSPSGPFGIGRAIEAWADPHTVDALAPRPGTPRELLVWIWYPAARSNDHAASGGDYVPVAMRAAAGSNRGLLPFLTRDTANVHAHSTADARVSLDRRSYPVLILRGSASAPVVNYTTLAEDLASHGYVVAGIDAPYRTSVVAFPDGRVMRRTADNNGEGCDRDPSCANRLLSAWVADMTFALDRLEQLNASDPSGTFTGRLDLARVGVFGHSFGGSQAAQFCHDDARCRAGVDVDGIPFGSVVQDGLRQPFMFLLSGSNAEADDAESRHVKSDIQSIYDRTPVDRRWLVAIRGGNHYLFSDDGALLKSHILMRVLRAFHVVGIDGPRQLDATRFCLRTFFDTYLVHSGSTRMALPDARYPEIDVLHWK